MRLEMLDEMPLKWQLDATGQMREVWVPVADALGAALGKELEVVDIPPARQSDALVEAGIPRPIADAITEMFDAFNAGLITPKGDRSLVGLLPSTM